MIRTYLYHFFRLQMILMLQILLVGILHQNSAWSIEIGSTPLLQAGSNLTARDDLSQLAQLEKMKSVPGKKVKSSLSNSNSNSKVRLVILKEYVYGANAGDYPGMATPISVFFAKRLGSKKEIELIIDKKRYRNLSDEKVQKIASQKKADFALWFQLDVSTSYDNPDDDSYYVYLIHYQKGKVATVSIEGTGGAKDGGLDVFEFEHAVRKLYGMFVVKATPHFQEARRSRSPKSVASLSKKDPPLPKVQKKKQPKSPQPSEALQPSPSRSEQTTPQGKKKVPEPHIDRAETPPLPQVSIFKAPKKPRGESRSTPSRLNRLGVYSKSWALVIGVNRYKNPSVSPLNYAVNDARSVEATLLKRGFKKDQMITLWNEKATKQNVIRALNSTLVRRTTEKDRVVIFFAGHGVTKDLPGKQGEEGYLLPYDADLNDLAFTAISMKSIKQITDRIPAKHILLLADACYSGFTLSRRAVGSELLGNKYLNLITQARTVQVITAGRRDQPVIEEGGHGVFTKHLLSALAGFGDLNGDGLVTSTELGAFIHPRVSRDSDHRQDPQFGNLSGEGQFVFFIGENLDARMDRLKALYYEKSISPRQLEKGLKILEAGKKDRLLEDFFNGKISLPTFKRLF